MVLLLDRMDNSVPRHGSSLTWNWAATSQVGPKWDWRHVVSLARWEETRDSGRVYWFLCPTLATCNIPVFWIKNWICWEPNSHTQAVVRRLYKERNNICPLWTTWLNDANIILIPFIFKCLVTPWTVKHTKLSVTWIIHSFNYEPVQKMSQP